MPAPSAYECASLLLDTVPGLMRSITGTLRQRHDGGDDAPTLGQLRMLAMLAERPWTLGELAARHHVTPSSMSRMVDVLVQRAWVERVSNPNDRRQVVLHLTPGGHDAHRALLRFAEESVAALIDRLDDQDRARLYDGLSVLRALVDHPCPHVIDHVSGETA
ncbi:MAG: MarR family transcriptional regulator [Chloroflexi bacterium]|nr:MarR family transcriptional regulator [Chloroflexota bacterium]